MTTALNSPNARPRRRRVLVMLAVLAWAAAAVVGHALTGESWAGSMVNALALLPFLAIGLILAFWVLIYLLDMAASLVGIAGMLILWPILGRKAAVGWSARLDAALVRAVDWALDLAGLAPDRSEAS